MAPRPVTVAENDEAAALMTVYPLLSDKARRRLRDLQDQAFLYGNDAIPAGTFTGLLPTNRKGKS